MITIRSGKLIIPEEDRFVGFAGDNLGNTKSIVLPDHGQDSCSYTLCLRFDDDSVRVIPLTKSLSGSNLVLTWNIQSAHLLKAGIVMAQVKSVGSDDVILHSSCDYFIVANSAELAGDGETEYVAREELEERFESILDEGGAVRTYLDDALNAKANKTTTIAGFSLSGNIRASDLAGNLSSYINPGTVQPNITSGYIGQFGKTYDDKPAMCMGGSTWIPLATANDLSEKMTLVPYVNSVADISNVNSGQIFTCQGGVGLKTSYGYIEFANKDNVYTRFEIDNMIGNLESLLSSV